MECGHRDLHHICDVVVLKWYGSWQSALQVSPYVRALVGLKELLPCIDDNDIKLGNGDVERS